MVVTVGLLLETHRIFGAAQEATGPSAAFCPRVPSEIDDL